MRRSVVRVVSAVLAVLAALPLGLAGCLSVPEFDEAALVDRPRVLAIVAEPPEAAPGETVRLSALLAAPPNARMTDDTLDYRVRWSICGAFSTVIGSQYDDGPQQEGCGPEADSFGDGPEVTLPGAVTAGLFANLELAEKILGAVLPAETIEAIKSDVGLPLLVEATVETDRGLERAVKRVIVNASGRGHHNPPPPHFDFDGVEIVEDSSAPFLCRAADRQTVSAAPDTKVELSPRVIGTDEEPEREYWIERYPILNARGELVERDEKPFYSWFTAAGELQEKVTEAPLRNEIWRTPRQAGVTPLWLVVRDGHGGTSACRLDVEILEAP